MMSKPTKVLAWHCINTSRKLGYGDGREVKAGRVLTVDEPDRISLCSYGLHASERLADALSYARTPIVCRVELSGNIIRGDDKLVASKRKCLWMVDATRTLRLWAVWCAERALKNERKAGREPDARCWKAIEVTRKFLNGKAQIDELIAAQKAAANAAARNKETDAQNRKLEAMVIALKRGGK